MPLTKLFQKRHSLKETSLVHETNKELEKLKSSFGKIETIKAQSESNLMASNHGVDTITPVTNSESPTAAEEDIFSKYEYIEKENEDSSFLEETFCTEMRRQSAPAESRNSTGKKTVKSASCSEQQSTSKASKTNRRNCVSESQADDFESSENDESRRLEFDNGKLEDMIGRCINRIIKESILTAVKSVNVEGIYEEIIENISSQRQNSIHDLTNNEEKCFSDVAEFAELDESSLNYRAEEQNNFGDEDESKETASYSENKKIETNSLGGYSADFEESMSLHSTDIEFKDQSSAKGSFADAAIIKDKNILAEEIPQTSNEPNKEDAETINTDEESSLLKVSIDAAEHLASVESDSKKNLTHDAEIEDYSIKNDLESPCATTSENAEDYQTQILADTTEDLKDDKCEKINSTSDEESSLMAISDDVVTLPKSALSHRDSSDSVLDSADCFVQTTISEEKNANNWKMGYLRVKLPQKDRGKKAHLKAWKKRCVSIQTDEFVNDPKNPCLMLSLYSAESGTARKRGATFWKSISCNKAAIFRSSSRSHKYAFTITDDNNVIIHLAADSETSSQEWMTAIRSILWPPSPVVQLEKMLYGKEFEISIVDNDFSFRAGLLGMYGYLTITDKKLILVHPQQGYVIQEWYLNTIDKFELMPQSKIEDAHKVLSMTTCSDSSTGKGEILMYCPEAVAMLQSIASTIHQILTVHIEQKGGKYDKELAEIAHWLVPATSKDGESPEDYYQVPPRQVKSLLDIPNFIFNKPITPSTTVTCCPGESMESRSLETAKTNITRASQDSGISAGNISEDMLNCSTNSFLVGGGQFPGKSSDSELSDSYTPPRSPLIHKKNASASTLQIP